MNLFRKSNIDYDKILSEYGSTVYKLALSQLKNIDDASDIYQEVFLRLVKRKPKFKSDEHMKAWLIRVTINCCKDYFRNYYQSNKRELVEDIPFQDQQHHEVYYYVQELDYRYRIVIHMFYYEQYTVKDIASVLNEKEATIKTRLSRGRAQLKQRMEGEQHA